MITKRVQKALDDLDQAIAEQDAALAACRSERDALVKDAARLDFIERQAMYIALDCRKFTNDPAWIFFDLATHARYGLGHLITDALAVLLDSPVVIIRVEWETDSTIILHIEKDENTPRFPEIGDSQAVRIVAARDTAIDAAQEPT